jgi:DNA-binding MarR family transcriptional regulator
MDRGAVHGDGTAVTPPDGSGVPGTASAEEAATGLGDEIVRFLRLLAAWKHSAKQDARAADRVLLARLVMDGDRRATDLAADVFLDLSTVSRQVRSLVERGLVERRPDPDDRRGSLLSATDAGRDAFQQYREMRDAQLAALLEPWPGEDRYQLIRLMARLNDDLVDQQQQTRECPGRTTGTADQQGESTR